MAMRRHEFLLELIELAHAQEMALAQQAHHEAEEEQLALALAREHVELAGRKLGRQQGPLAHVYAQRLLLVAAAAR